MNSLCLKKKRIYENMVHTLFRTTTLSTKSLFGRAPVNSLDCSPFWEMKIDLRFLEERFLFAIVKKTSLEGCRKRRFTIPEGSKNCYMRSQNKNLALLRSRMNF